MAVVYVNGVAQVRLFWNIGGQIGYTILHWQRNTPAVPWVQSDMQSLVDLHMSTFAGGGPAIIPTSTTLNGCDGADLSNVPSPAVATSTHAAVVGTRAGVGLPPNCAVNISQKTGARYRGGHGRMYMPGGVQTDLQAANNQWTTAYVNLWVGQWNSMISSIETFISGVFPCVVRYTYNIVVDPTTGKTHRERIGVKSVDQILSRAGQLIIGSQRNRLRA